MGEFQTWYSIPHLGNQYLKQHLVNGYTINEKRIREDRNKLKELQKTLKITERLLQRKALDSKETTGLLKATLDYQKALHLLNEYDYQKLEIEKVTTLIVLSIKKYYYNYKK